MLPVVVRNRMNRIVDPFESVSREFDRILGQYMGENALTEGWAPYPIDIREDADHIIVEAELPGFRKEDCELTLENGILTIRAQRKESPVPGTRLHSERRWTQFQRSFSLPTSVNENQVQAGLKDGILTITLTKKEEVKPKKIAIQEETGHNQGQLQGGQ